MTVSIALLIGSSPIAKTLKTLAQEVCAALAKNCNRLMAKRIHHLVVSRVVNATRDMQRKYITAEKITATYSELADLARVNKTGAG